MPNQSIGAETAEALITKNIPTISPNQKVKAAMELVAKESWDNISNIYLISEQHKLVGEVPIHKLILAQENTQLDEISQKPKVILDSNADQEKIVIAAIENDLKSVPIEDRNNHFLGIVTADKIIDVLHEEHLEDFLRSSGIRGRGARILDFLHIGYFEIIKARLPWLVIGLFIGITASFVVSRFEETLQQHTALAFFISMVAYMSDSIGTQTETIFIRAQSMLKFNVFNYIVREYIIGVLIGTILGTISGIFAYFLSGSIEIALILGISLLLSMSFATVLACLTPIILKSLGKDPAVGSGPFTTAIQDMVSLLVYFSIAMIIIGQFGG